MRQPGSSQLLLPPTAFLPTVLQLGRVQYAVEQRADADMPTTMVEPVKLDLVSRHGPRVVILCRCLLCAESADQPLRCINVVVVLIKPLGEAERGASGKHEADEEVSRLVAGQSACNDEPEDQLLTVTVGRYVWQGRKVGKE